MPLPLIPIAVAAGGAYAFKKWSDKNHAEALAAATNHAITSSLPSGPTPGSAGPAGVDVGPPTATVQTPTEQPMVMRVVTAPQPAPISADPANVTAQANVVRTLLIQNKSGANYATAPAGTAEANLMANIKKFQGMVNLGQDGLYGPTCAGAVLYFSNIGVGTPQPVPPPWFYGNGERLINAYTAWTTPHGFSAGWPTTNNVPAPILKPVSAGFTVDPNTHQIMPNMAWKDPGGYAPGQAQQGPPAPPPMQPPASAVPPYKSQSPIDSAKDALLKAGISAGAAAVPGVINTVGNSLKSILPSWAGGTSTPSPYTNLPTGEPMGPPAPMDGPPPPPSPMGPPAPDYTNADQQAAAYGWGG